MFRKIILKINSRHLPPLFWITGLFFMIAAGILYWRRVYLGEDVFPPLFFLFLTLFLTWGILEVLSRHVYRRDGFIDGMENGYLKGKTDGELKKV